MITALTTLSLSTTGHLHLTPLHDEDSNIDNQQAINEKSIVKAFTSSQAEGLISLATTAHNQSWPLALTFWRDFTARYLSSLCQVPQTASLGAEPIPAPSISELTNLTLGIPPMPGAEYCTQDVLEAIWIDLDKWAHNEIQRIGYGISGFLKKHAPLWHQVGRVCFHLAENKLDTNYPFAFLASYAPRLGKNTRLQYQPIKQALAQSVDENNKQALIRLLEPVYKASKRCAWVHDLLESGDIYHPLAWTPSEAHTMLKSIPDLEESGLTVRLPNWWKKRSRARVQVTIGDTKKKNSFGIDALLDFDIDIAIDGKPLSKEELASILDSKGGLIALRGQWVEVDPEKLNQALAHWKSVKDDVAEGGISFVEGMRLLAGTSRDLTEDNDLEEQSQSWAYVEAGSWLKEVLCGLRNPESLCASKPGKTLHATLRSYQQTGANWLWFLSELGLGACLADDMGLGKTIQIITLLLAKKKQYGNKREVSLLILPASLLSNWKDELERFAPSLNAIYLHSSEISRNKLDDIACNPNKHLKDHDLLITTYGMLLRQPWLQEQSWDLVILDESQAIKNPGTRQTKAVKTLKGRTRLALTGTPVENRLGDLWSLFDFLCPGLLGSASRFKKFIVALEKRGHNSFAPLRQLVQPYILRRLKTDKTIISDLPDKTEITAWCGLTKTQTKLYAKAVQDLGASLDGEDGIKRRGIVLAFLLYFKQICNHPSHMLGDGEYATNASGKFIRLREICEEIASRQEKVLIFTQFREMTAPLAKFLGEVFGQEGLVLHGGTPVKKRKTLVNQFQQEDGPPFFVLSLKAAGVGLNLTAANHVIHFDRWWNPAVENQATDRTFRIGQKRNVLVHKFVCRGTIEEKIDALINEKKQMIKDVLVSGGETMLTELDDKALLEMVTLDLEKAQF